MLRAFGAFGLADKVGEQSYGVVVAIGALVDGCEVSTFHHPIGVPGREGRLLRFELPLLDRDQLVVNFSGFFWPVFFVEP